MPEQDVIDDTQFGFRQGRDTLSACSFLNDVIYYFKDQGTPVYICSLDAEKCFDKIWHDGLFHKLKNILPVNHWLLLYRWYGSSFVRIKWHGNFSDSFQVSRGTKQGSILSPIFFNYFISDLLKELRCKKDGVCIDDKCYNNFAYADDLSLLATTVSGLQNLIDTCYSYSQKWRFTFSLSKTKCMIAGGNILKATPEWHLNNSVLDVTHSLGILGVIFNSNGNSNDHINNRTSACRRCMYSLQEIGFAYPGLSTEVKVHLWNTMGLPTLLYGAESLNIYVKDTKELCSTQAFNIKRCLGLSNRSHHSMLLTAAGVRPIQELIRTRTLSLYKRIFNVESPTRSLNMYFLARYIATGETIDGTLLSRIVCQGASPLSVIYTSVNVPRAPAENSGVIDSLRFLLHSENYIKPWSMEHHLVKLLTRPF